MYDDILDGNQEQSKPYADIVDKPEVQPYADILDNAQPAQPEQTSAMGAAVRAAATNVIPTAGALAGGTAGAETGALIGSVFPGPGTVIGGVIGGLVGGFAGGHYAGKAQEAVAEKVAPDLWKQTQMLQAEDQKQHPYISTAAGLIPFAITHKVSPEEIPSIIKNGRDLWTTIAGQPLKIAQAELAKPENAEKLNKLMNMAVGAGFMGGNEAWNQIQGGDMSPIDRVVRIGIATLGGASFTTAREGTPRLFGGTPSKVEPISPEAVAKQAIQDTKVKEAFTPKEETTTQLVPETQTEEQKLQDMGLAPKPVETENILPLSEVESSPTTEQASKAQVEAKPTAEGANMPIAEPVIAQGETVKRPMIEEGKNETQGLQQEIPGTNETSHEAGVQPNRGNEQGSKNVGARSEAVARDLIPADEIPFNLERQSAPDNEAIVEEKARQVSEQEANAKRQSEFKDLGADVLGRKATNLHELLNLNEAVSDIKQEKSFTTSAEMRERTFSEHIDVEMSRAKQEGLSTLGQTLHGIKAGWNYMVELAKGLPSDDGVHQAVSMHESTYQKAENIARQFYKNLIKDIPNEKTWDAISRYADVGGSSKRLQKGIEEAPERYKQSYRDAMNLNEHEQAVATEMRRTFDAIGERLREQGLLRGTVENYFRRFFNIKDETTLAAVMNSFMKDKGMKQEDWVNQKIMPEKGIQETSGITGRLGSPDFARQFPTDLEAMKWAEMRMIELKKEGILTNITVESNALKRMMDYYLTAVKSESDAKLINDFKVAKQMDGRLAIITREDLETFRGISQRDPEKTARQNFKEYINEMRTEVKARDATVDNVGDQKTMHPSLRDEAIAKAEQRVRESKDALTKAERLMDMSAKDKNGNIFEPDLKDYVMKAYDGMGKTSNEAWIHPDALSHVKAMFELSALRNSVALKISSEFKQAMLSFSMFHPVQLAIHGMEHRVNPFNLIDKLDFSGDTEQSVRMTRLSDAGLIHTATAELNAIMEGVTGGGGLFSKIPILGERLAKMNQWIFEDFQPRLKMTMALDALARNEKRFAKELALNKADPSKGMSDYQLHRLTAEQANAAFGGVNYKLLGRNTTFQDGLRMALLAPDFFEARARFVGQALTGYGQEQRTALILGATALYTLARIANLMISGRPHLEPENVFSVVADNKAWSLRTIQGDILRAIMEPGKFVLGRVNPMIVKPAIEATTGRDFFGRQRSGTEQVKDMIQTAVPISMRGLLGDQRREEGFMQQLGSVFGFGAKRYQDTATIYKKANDWKAANNIQERGEFIYDPEKDPYRSLKFALSDGKTDDAIADIHTYMKLPQVGPVQKTDGQKLAYLTDHFYRYATSPFTGSKVNEFTFVKGMNEDEKAAYKSARDEKQQIFREFIKARNLYIEERAKGMNI